MEEDKREQNVEEIREDATVKEQAARKLHEELVNGRASGETDGWIKIDEDENAWRM